MTLGHDLSCIGVIVVIYLSYLLWIFPGERRLKCSENFEELGNILQLTLVYRDACHALFFISKQLNVLGMLL